MHTLPASLKRLGIPGDTVLLVHSSFRGMSREGLTPEQVIADLAEYMMDGTLLLPTMSWRYVKPAKPDFSELETPSNTGVLTEIFRTRFATRRSLHPTHSVAGLGAQVNEMLNEHHLDETPCSARSPFGKLILADGWVLMLGIGFDCCTLVHHGEEVVAPDLYLRPASETEIYRCTDRHGMTHPVRLRRHLFLPRDYWQFQDKLAKDDCLKVDYIGNVVIMAFRARDLYMRVIQTLTERGDAILARPGQRYRRM